ncbi:unnamed protein product [Auanema sp. JU1783]|nr:unnamed protein product [Auanema sp. JU1783]
MENFILSSDCQHAQGGLCSKCVLNQTFSISQAEDRRRRNTSNNSIKNIGNLNSRNGSSTSINSQAKEKEDSSIHSPPVSLPVLTTQPQNDSIDCNETPEYVSFGDLFANVKIQEENNKEIERMVKLSPRVEETDSLLMRLFKSDLFTLPIALQYLHSSTEKGIQEYLGSRLVEFPDKDVDFYIPQLIHLYVHQSGVANALQNYMEMRCKRSVHFSLLCLWLLESFAPRGVRFKTTSNNAEKLRQSILNGFGAENQVLLLSKNLDVQNVSIRMNVSLLSPASLDFRLSRSESAASSLFCLAPSSLALGRTLEDACECLLTTSNEICQCKYNPKRLTIEKEFVSWLTGIGLKLTGFPTKQEKTRQLINELEMLNMHLPARVWIPLHENHIVLRIPPTNSCVLNSKDKAPYCIYVEILHCDTRTVKVPKRLSESDNELIYHLRNESPDLSGSNPFENPLNFDYDTHEITVVDDARSEMLRESSVAPDPAWDTMSLETSVSEPVLGSNYLQARKLGRKFKSLMKAHPDDPSASTLSEPWDEKRERIRLASPYCRMPGWDLLPVIVKSGDDLSQELLAYQLLHTFKSIWAEEKVSLYLRPYRILVTSTDSGMIEPVVDACSLHQIKRNQYTVMKEEGKTGTPCLLDYFVDTFGPKRSDSYMRAQLNFVESCAGYSLLCYYLQLKDRHNGNILIDSEGHLIHIDFGFILSSSPRNLGFETASFKLTTEFIDVMDGFNSPLFCYYKVLIIKGLIATRKHHEKILSLVDMMSKSSRLPCFRAGPAVVKALQERFHINYTDKQLEVLVNTMVDQNRDSLTTRLYDNFQYYTNGIL